jgi:hypothetical protein
MIVTVEPKRWYRLDTRPPLFGVTERLHGVSNDDDVAALGTRLASEYLGRPLSGTDAVIKRRKGEFEFDRVLSLGVGNYHYYESWIEDHGGEIQSLHQSGPFGLPLNVSLYGIFNGPLWDGDGACDGTCNFYILVQLKHKYHPRFGILWCDEQTYFTKRWRLLDPRDIEPSKVDLPHSLNLSLCAALARDSGDEGVLGVLLNKAVRLRPDPLLNDRPIRAPLGQ